MEWRVGSMHSIWKWESKQQAQGRAREHLLGRHQRPRWLQGCLCLSEGCGYRAGLDSGLGGHIPEGACFGFCQGSKGSQQRQDYIFLEDRSGLGMAKGTGKDA